MKNLKKVLALVLAMALSFTMFAGAVAFDDVEIGSDYSAAISMLSDLNVISGDGKGNYNPNGTITRAEACVLIANIMNGGKADTARFAGGSNFSDVAKTFWGESAIAYCVQNGVAYGVGGGKFAPSREITDAEFVAMVTRAMGYDTAANPLSFPYGNYTAAVNNGLLANVPYAEGSDCTRGEAAQVLYDALFADYARLTANLNVIHNADDHDDAASLIKDVFGLTKACDDAKNCKQHYWVITGESCADDEVVFVKSISDKGNKVGESKVTSFECTADVSALVGYKVVLWGETAHADDVETIKAVEVVEGQATYAFNPTMDIEDDLGLDKDDWNDGAMLGFKGTITEKNGNSYVLIDWENDGDIDFIDATERFYGEVTSLNSKKVIIESADKAYTLDLADGETTKWDCACGADKHDYVVELNAEEEDIVEVTASCDYKKTLTITINAIEPVTKTFTKWNSKGEYQFDGEKVEVADAAAWDSVNGKVTFAKNELKKDFDLYLNANGYVVYEKEAASDKDGILMILDSENGTHKSTEAKSTKASIEAMLADGTLVDFNLAFDAKFVTGEYDKDHYEFDASEANFVGGVFEYTLNADGDIKELEAITATGDAYSYDDQWNRLTVDGHLYKYTGKSFTFVVEDDYVVAHNNDQEDLYVKSAKVRALELTELPDIATGDTDTADLGAYAGERIAYTAVSATNDPDDVIKGAVMVVTDFAVLGEYTYIPALLTYVSYDGDVFTFTGAANGVYGDIESVEADVMSEIASVPADAAKLETLVDTETAWASIGEAVYAELKLNADGKVVNVELMKADGNVLESAHYFVVRGALTEADATDVELAPAYADEAGTAIVAINYPNTAAKTFDLDKHDVEYFTIDQAPKMSANALLKTADGFKAGVDGDIEAEGTIALSHYDKKATQDFYYFADLVIKVDGTDVNNVYSVFLFEDEIDETDSLATAKAKKAAAEKAAAEYDAITAVAAEKWMDKIDADRAVVTAEGAVKTAAEAVEAAADVADEAKTEAEELAAAAEAAADAAADAADAADEAEKAWFAAQLADYEAEGYFNGYMFIETKSAAKVKAEAVEAAEAKMNAAEADAETAAAEAAEAAEAADVAAADLAEAAADLKAKQDILKAKQDDLKTAQDTAAAAKTACDEIAVDVNAALKAKDDAAAAAKAAADAYVAAGGNVADI